MRERLGREREPRGARDPAILNWRETGAPIAGASAGVLIGLLPRRQSYCVPATEWVHGTP